MSKAETARIRFGTFDFDPATGELRRDGSPVRLQSQPAQVLGLLVAHAGEVVTRDTLRRAIWGTDTFVDFDRGLNFCVAQIRAARGDSAESPRFVKTLPKRGYQFIAPVASLARPEHPEAPAKLRFPNRLLAAATLLALIGASIFFLIRRAAPAPVVRIAVARFDNQTGSAEFDRFVDGLTDAVVADLTGAGMDHYSVIGNAAILRQPRAARDLITIASSLKVGYIVLGQVQRNPSGIHVLAHLIRLPDQAHVMVARLDSAEADPHSSQSDLAHRIATAFSPCLPPNAGCSRLIPRGK